MSSNREIMLNELSDLDADAAGVEPAGPAVTWCYRRPS